MSKVQQNIKYVSDVIDWDTDIEPYQVTLIICGCGSGKTTWIENLADSYMSNKTNHRIAQITSRSSKRKEELASGHDYSGIVNYEDNVKLDPYSYYQRCTSSDTPEGYEKYLCENGNLVQNAVVVPIQIDSFFVEGSFIGDEILFNTIDSLWSNFDLIVVDEIHSLLLDSSFMISQARLGEMIKAFVKRCTDPNKHMILMTATGNCIKPILKGWIKNLHVLDLSKKTFSVTPKEIRVTPIEQVKREQEILYQNNIKFIYFYNGKAIKLSDYCRDTALDKKDGVSLFTDPKLREILRCTDPEEYKKMIEVEEYLAKHQCFPDYIKFVLSTSKYREAVSIKNYDFLYMYVDSHIPDEVIQYSGRLRCSSYTLTIVDGAFQYGSKALNEIEKYAESKEADIKEANEFFNRSDDKTFRYFAIGRFESKYRSLKNITYKNRLYKPFIFFNPFTLEFEYNQLKADGLKYIAECIEKWNSLDRTKKTSFSKYIRSWFSTKVNVQNYETKEWQSLQILKKNGFYVNSNNSNAQKHYYSEDKINDLIAQLQTLWGNYKDINKYIHLFAPDLSLQKVRYGNHKGMYELIRI